jgi:hypothetical protein
MYLTTVRLFQTALDAVGNELADLGGHNLPAIP